MGICIIVAIVFLIFFLMAKTWPHRLNKLPEGTVTVTNIEYKADRVDSTTIENEEYLITVEVACEGKHYEDRISLASPEGYRVGERFAVRCNPSKKSWTREDEIEKSRTNGASAYFLLAISLFLFVLGGVFWASAKYPEFRISAEAILFPGLFGFLGVIFVAVGIYMLKKQIIFSRQRKEGGYREVPSVCVEYLRDLKPSGQNSRGGYMYFPILEYKIDEETKRLTSMPGTTWKRLSIGQPVTLYQDLETGEVVEKANRLSIVLPVGALVMGLLSCAACIAIAINAAGI